MLSSAVNWSLSLSAMWLGRPRDQWAGPSDQASGSLRCPGEHLGGSAGLLCPATEDPCCVGLRQRPGLETGQGWAGFASFWLRESLSPWVPTSTPQTGTSARPHLRGPQGGRENEDMQWGLQQHTVQRPAFILRRLSAPDVEISFLLPRRQNECRCSNLGFVFFFNFLT